MNEYCVQSMDGDLMENSLCFLLDCEWVHNFQVTSILQHNVCQQIPDKWGQYLRKLPMTSLNQIPFLGENSKQKYPDWPDSLHDFLSKSSSLSLQRSCDDPSCMGILPMTFDLKMAQGMNPKKHHEVSHMSSLVNDAVVNANCDLIVDVGSGLGYLDHVIHQVYGHRVLGLETDQCHASAAENRAAKQGIDCGGVKSVQFNIDDTSECRSRLELFLREINLSLTCQHQVLHQAEKDGQKEDTTPRVCLIGLHCCGDLTTSMLSLFHNAHYVKALCCVSCCYHKMAYSEGKFTNFPLSEDGKRKLDKLMEIHGRPASSSFITPFTLRLGAQETKCRWQQQTEADHACHINHVAFRGLLALTDEDATSVRQKVRKCNFTNFETFLESYQDNIPLPDADLEQRAKRMRTLRDLYEKLKDDFDLIEVLTALQVVVQPVIETTVYQDRIHWLKENGHASAKVVPIFNEFISPRNLAIVVLRS